MLSATIRFIKKVDVEKKVAGLIDSEMDALAGMLEADIKEQTPVITGRLKASMIGSKVGFCKGKVSTDVEYAPYVEFGTSKMEPRAMMRKGGTIFAPRGLKYLQDKLKSL